MKVTICDMCKKPIHPSIIYKAGDIRKIKLVYSETLSPEFTLAGVEGTTTLDICPMCSKKIRNLIYKENNLIF